MLTQQRGEVAMISVSESIAFITGVGRLEAYVNFLHILLGLIRRANPDTLGVRYLTCSRRWGLLGT